MATALKAPYIRSFKLRTGSRTLVSLAPAGKGITKGNTDSPAGSYINSFFSKKANKSQKVAGIEEEPRELQEEASHRKGDERHRPSRSEQHRKWSRYSASESLSGRKIAPFRDKTSNSSRRIGEEDRVSKDDSFSERRTRSTSIFDYRKNKNFIPKTSSRSDLGNSSYGDCNSHVYDEEDKDLIWDEGAYAGQSSTRDAYKTKREWTRRPESSSRYTNKSHHDSTSRERTFASQPSGEYTNSMRMRSFDKSYSRESERDYKSNTSVRGQRARYDQSAMAESYDAHLDAYRDSLLEEIDNSTSDINDFSPQKLNKPEEDDIDSSNAETRGLSYRDSLLLKMNSGSVTGPLQKPSQPIEPNRMEKKPTPFRERSPYGDWKRTGLLDSQYPAGKCQYHPFAEPGETRKPLYDFAFKDLINSTRTAAELYSTPAYQKCLQARRISQFEPFLLPHMLPARVPKEIDLWSSVHQRTMNLIIEMKECWEEIYPHFRDLWTENVKKKGLSDKPKYKKIPNIDSLCWRFYNNYCAIGPIRKGNKAFSRDEDRNILNALEKYGATTGNWRHICEKVPRRSPNIIWRRYREKLEPVHERLHWSKEDLDTLLHGISRYGRDFQTIRTLYFPYSTANLLQRKWEHKVWNYEPLKKHGLARFYPRENKGAFLHPKYMGDKRFDKGYDTEEHLLQEWQLSQESFVEKQEMQEREQFIAFGDTGIKWWTYDEEPEEEDDDDEYQDADADAKDEMGYW